MLMIYAIVRYFVREKEMKCSLGTMSATNGLLPDGLVDNGNHELTLCFSLSC